MGFIGSLKKIIEIFYSQGSRQFLLIFIISFSGIIIELAGLMMLYVVVSSLFQMLDVIHFPILNYSVPTFIGVILLVGIYFFKFIFSIWQNRYTITFCYNINYKITTKIIEYYYSQPAETFRSNKLADALNKVFTIGGFFSEVIFQSVLIFFSEAFLTLILLIALLVFNYKLFVLLVLILLPVCIVLLYFSRKKLKVISGNLMPHNVEYHQSVMTMFMGLLDIKLSGRYSYFFNIFNAKINNLHTTRKIITLENYFPPKVLEFVAVLGIAVLFFITHWLGNDIYMAGFLAAFATATFRFIPSINRIISSVQNLQLYTEYIKFIYEIKDKSTEIAEENNDVVNLQIDSIKLKNISFSYPNQSLLNHISIDLKNSKILGITGPSGAGKTTLVNIISGLLSPQSGEMFLNENPITPEIKNALLHKSAYVMQDPYFINGTLMENVVFGYDTGNRDKLNWCIKCVNMEDWVQHQPLGLETILGENGTKLSGGQKQRLAIARALYRKATLLILDEPSNSLDSDNKQSILKLVKELTFNEKLITIIVSHDEDVLKICDSLYELKKTDF